jgi:hypothetical protein
LTPSIVSNDGKATIALNFRAPKTPTEENNQ